MAEFYGWVQGNRGESTRLGSKNSGIYAGVKSWEVKADIQMRKNKLGNHLIGVGIKSDSLSKNDIVDIDIEKIENVKINGIELKELLEAHKLFRFPDNLEMGGKNENK